MTQTATIEQLRPGDEYPGGSINSRKDYTKEQISERLESILSFGILQSLLVCPAPNQSGPPYYVAAGGLRRAAVEQGVKAKKLSPDFEIPITIRSEWDSAMALAASIEENNEVVEPHPVAAYEQFAELTNRGKTPEDIAKLFRMELKDVRRILALGMLSPVIRKAWLNHDIDADAAKAFTRAKDQKHQEDVFRHLKKQNGQVHAWHVKQTVSGNQQDADRFLKFVGRKEYEAAGGKVQEDLFAGNGEEKLIVQDMPLLLKLRGEKLDAKAKELTDNGWAWASTPDDLPSGARYNWGRIPSAGANTSAEQKAKSGCVFEIDRQGKLEVTYGVLKPGTKLQKQGSSKGGTDKPAAPSNVLSNSLRSDLDAMAARATRDALGDRTLGDGLLGLLARIIAAQIEPDRLNYTARPVLTKLAAIRDEIADDLITEALQKRFDRQRYFGSAPKGLVLKAIKEAVGDEHAKKLASGTKAAAWKFALANVPKNWLPPELRTTHYAGPAKTTVTKLKAKRKPQAAAQKPKRKAA